MTPNTQGLLVRFDPLADALYVSLRPMTPGIVKRSHRLDERRAIDYDERGEVIGVELLYPSEGVDLEGLPRADDIRDALAQLVSMRVSERHSLAG